MICHVLSVILGGNVVAAGSELYRCTHFQFVITLLQKIQHMEGDYIQLQEFFYQDLLSLTTIRSIATDFSASSEFHPLKKSKKPTPHIGNSEEVYIFAALEHHFHAFFL